MNYGQQESWTRIRRQVIPTGMALAGAAVTRAPPSRLAPTAAGAQAAPATTTPVQDPLNGPFLGRAPEILPDVPVSVFFLIMFALGAGVHYSIYRSNAKRGHKFFLSDLLTDFCLVRVVSSIFRIIWSFTGPRGVVLLAIISQNAGSIVLFNLNLFFTQYIIRAMHPRFGQSAAFRYTFYFFIISIPIVAVLDAISTVVSFFSPGIKSRLDAAETALKFGASWTLILSVLPIVLLHGASAFPGPEPTSFGTGQLRNKVALLMFSVVTLAAGAVVRLAAIFNTDAGLNNSPLFDRPTFYTTGMMLELLTVAVYAYFRVDLLFHVSDVVLAPRDDESSPTDEKAMVMIDTNSIRESEYMGKDVDNSSQEALVYGAYVDADDRDVKTKDEITSPHGAEGVGEGAEAEVNKVSRRKSIKSVVRETITRVERKNFESNWI